MKLDATFWNSLVVSVSAQLTAAGEAQSCILASHVLIRALGKLRQLTAVAVATEVRILNPALYSRLQCLDSPTQTEIDEAMNASNSKQLTIDPQSASKGRWSRHLVIVIPELFGERDGLLDVTAPQFDEKAADIKLGPVLAPVNADFRREDCVATRFPVNGSLITYTSFPADLGYQSTDAWIWSQSHERILKGTIDDLLG